ncbi:hypothetical protein [Cohaesibacter celericrescens]|uniref:Uncharacterized protein n=1 Tax=Cohaesibacter celericrescens TaxID=2067669 RepID=A0A2N5XKB3_9HYPH|nr:hypothetical protein [Cohaesibacter celericrescens]PLW74925.1 hypothetical protein C0081_21695 [Cohaesibacter celericrescens]
MIQGHSVRPHLLDEDAIRKAIFSTGLQSHQRGQIVNALVENYTVDLDLLAATFAVLGSLRKDDTRISRAA